MTRHHDQFAPVVGKRVIHRQTASLYSGQAIELFFQLPVQCLQLRLRVGRWWSVHIHHHAPLHLISEVLMLQLVQASRQHRRAGHQHNGQRRLYHQQRLAREGRPIPGSAAGTAQRLRRIGARGKPRGSRPKNDSRQQRQPQRKGQHHERRRDTNRQKMRVVERQCQQQSRRCHCHHQAGDSSANRQQYAFRKRFRNNLPWRRAQRQPHRGLPSPRNTASQQ